MAEGPGRCGFASRECLLFGSAPGDLQFSHEAGVGLHEFPGIGVRDALLTCSGPVLDEGDNAVRPAPRGFCEQQNGAEKYDPQTHPHNDHLAVGPAAHHLIGHDHQGRKRAGQEQGDPYLAPWKREPMAPRVWKAVATRVTPPWLVGK